ncbi:MAG TPA: hypothetical protein VGD81_18545 [Opitutaceae bacterium]
MPTAKVSVVQLMDHGIDAAPVAAFGPVEEDTAVAPALLPGEAEMRVLKVAKTVSVKDVQMTRVSKAVLAAKTPAQFAAAMIKGRYQALGGAKGFLGAAQTTITVCPDRVGYFQHFKGGSIYYHPQTGAHEVHGLIRAKWAALGWERSFLGYPRTDETVGRDTKHEGRYNHFQGGSVFWHPAAGAHEVHGAIRAKYLELGAEASFLGYPTTDETATPDGAGRFNHFQAGSIYWTARTGAHEVHGLIRNAWAQHGWERNPQLGYPISDELIPHRGIGYTRVPSIRKPLLNVPLDVIRLPDEPAPAGPAPAVKTAGARRVAVASAATTAAASESATVTRAALAPGGASVTLAAGAGTSLAGSLAPAAVEAVVAPAPRLAGLKAMRTTAAARITAVQPVTVVEVATLTPVVTAPASHKGQSRDRYSDFENGLVFWQRGTQVAVMLPPRAKAPNGAKMAWTGAEIATLARARIQEVLTNFPGASIVSVNYAGTTGYSFDGAGVHNRAHRLHVILRGERKIGPVSTPALATVEVQVEVGFDPVDREIVGYLSKWSLVASPGDFLGGGSLVRALHQRLDPALWRQFLIARVPAPASDPIAVLSVKTQADGDVAVYFEP